LSNRDTKDSTEGIKNSNNYNIVPGPTVIKETSSKKSSVEIINNRGEIISNTIK